MKKEVMKIDEDYCFICGRIFDEKIKKTFHHSIPQRLKPVNNVKVPVCADCHIKQNAEDNTYKRYFHALKIIMKGMEKKINETKN